MLLRFSILVISRPGKSLKVNQDLFEDRENCTFLPRQITVSRNNGKGKGKPT
jgi:hypothetical protein